MLVVNNIYFSDYYYDRRIKRDEKYKKLNIHLIQEAREQIDEYDIEILNVIKQFKIVTMQHLLDLYYAKYILKDCDYKAIQKFFSKRINKLYNLACLDCLYPAVKVGDGRAKGIITLYKMAPHILSKKIKIKSINSLYKHNLAKNDIIVFLIKNSNLKFYINEYTVDFVDSYKEKKIQCDVFAEYIHSNYNYISFFEADMYDDLNLRRIEEKLKNYLDYMRSGEWAGDNKVQNIGKVYNRFCSKGVIVPKLIIVVNKNERQTKIESYIKKNIDQNLIVRGTAVYFDIKICSLNNIKI